MQFIDEQNAVEYLRAVGLLALGDQAQVRELSGGVSNAVFYVQRDGGPDFVLKQAREQLRVADPWFCSVERIWREVETMRVCSIVLAEAHRDSARVDRHSRAGGNPPSVVPTTTPDVLFTDRENYLYAMTAVPTHQTWKQRLLAGETSVDIAAACGWLLGELHARTWRGQHLPPEFSDRGFFDALRIDPYYRHIARVHPDLQPAIQGLIDEMAGQQWSLVHGDFSPKNLLLHDGGLVLVDFEVGHFGDPAFDLGFFLTHLLLKAIRAGDRSGDYLRLVETFWQIYRARVSVVANQQWQALERRACLNLAACLLARIDGKSQVEYLDEAQRALVRHFARGAILSPVSTLSKLLEMAKRAV